MDHPIRASRLMWRAAVLTVVVAVVLLAVATTTFAAPPSDTISIDQIQAMLETGTPVTGYFDTVLGGPTLASQTPTPIPVTVKAIVPDGGPAGDLILFEASGADIATIGGIAHGMSGSPLYIDVGGGTYELAGAVSYGDIFTTHYLGLATAIDDMIAIETTYMTAPEITAARGARTVELEAPVKTATAGKVRSITVAPSRKAASRLSRSATGPVMAPLTVVQVNGLDRRSALFKKLVASFAARGIDIAPFSAGARKGGPAAPMPTSGGDSLGALYATGDVSIGSLGTVTYVDPDNHVLLAYGHPFDWFGPHSLFLTSAWVQGVWSTTMDPYKVMSPGAVAGEITQDRAAGIAGTLGAPPAAVPITSEATMGSVTRSQSSAAASFVVHSPYFSGLPSYVAGAVMYKVADASMLPGSAVTSVTIDVTDGSDDYVIQRDNVWSDSFDVCSTAVGDINAAFAALVPPPAGVTATVTSVAISADLSRKQKNATITDVSCPGGLQTGSNTLTVTLTAADGSTLNVPVTLELPPGYARQGFLTVSPAAGGGEFAAPAKAAGTTLADVVGAINSAPTNSQIHVDFIPKSGPDDATLSAVGDTHKWMVEGNVMKDTGRLAVRAPATVVKGKAFSINGRVVSADGDTTLTLYKRVAGTSTYQVVGPVQATATGDGSAVFSKKVRITKNTSFKLVWEGDGSHLGATWTKLVRVK